MSCLHLRDPYHFPCSLPQVYPKFQFLLISVIIPAFSTGEEISPQTAQAPRQSITWSSVWVFDPSSVRFGASQESLSVRLPANMSDTTMMDTLNSPSDNGPSRKRLRTSHAVGILLYPLSSRRGCRVVMNLEHEDEDLHGWSALLV